MIVGNLHHFKVQDVTHTENVFPAYIYLLLAIKV